MQSSGAGKPAVGIVFDSDIGNRIDSALALALLYGFDSKNEARVVSISVSKPNLKAAAFCDVVAKFYAAGGFGRQLPIGLAETGKAPEDTPMLTEPLSKRNAEGQPAYRHAITNINDTAEVGALIRNALTAQHDGNCAVVVAGPATNLAQVLNVRGAKEWIERKVKLLVFAGGAYPSGGPDEHIQTDIAAAKQLFAEWPSPIIASGREVGEELLFPGESIERDFAWSQAHPIVDAYRAHKPMPYDAPSWDMTAVLYAVRPQESYFKHSDHGTIGVLDDGRTTFTPSANGKHRYLIFDPEQKDRIIKTYTEIASIKPTPRQRFRPPQM
jgi:inosine-uridine nucleoside N-ribohydrolase